MLAFVTPKANLLPGSLYSFKLSGVVDSTNNSVAFAQFVFTTAGEAPNPEDWTPGADWLSHRTDSKWQHLPPLHAPPGVTALAGQALKLNGEPLRNATLIIDDTLKATSDATGRFLIAPIPSAGHHVLVVDGSTANSSINTYGIYEAGVDIIAGQTNVRNYFTVSVIR